MRIDLVTVFPEYFEPLRLSLVGRAQDAGTITCAVHDLRDFTDDRHRTVDDTPYGGGAGMVMTAPPWGRALERLAPAATATLVIPTPAGTCFTQDTARMLATQERLVFACGRYEGIDQRVVDDADRDSRWRVEELSIGDYVVCGGEAAALVMIEAVVRLLPGVLGNTASLDEESHGAGLLEAPTFTKPRSWRGLDVPSVLLSGDHSAVAGWRRQASLRRTAHVRPDLLRTLRPDQCDQSDLQILASLGWVPHGDGFAPAAGDDG